jgi:hypothetical protein
MAGSRGRKSSQAASLGHEIAHLRGLDLAGLRSRWKAVFRKPAPSHLSRHLLFGILAYRLQADELGDLTPDTMRLLKQLGGGGSTVEAVRLTSELSQRRTALRAGTILVREWNGNPQRVMVMADNFAWNGRSFGSLSAVAFAITGTRWNGHRFFGLRDKMRAASSGGDIS